MSAVTQLSFDEEARDSLVRERQEREEKRREYRRNHKLDPRKEFKSVPVRGGMRFCIAPEVAPIIEILAARCAEESPDPPGKGLKGIYTLAARAAVVMKKNPESIVRRLYSVVNKKQLFVAADFVECVLLSMDAEYEFQYGEWPSCRADALEIVADFAEGKHGPDKLLKRANRLYEKGVRKALKHAVELNI